MEHLLGKSYFETGDYDLAIEYLKKYESQTEKLNQEDFYQIGFVYYKNGNYKEALKHFKELSTQDNVLGQNALFLIGDCYLKQGEKNFARNAFGECAKLNYDKSTQKEAEWNFAKLSYELKYDDVAIQAFQKIDTSSKYHDEAQTLLSKLFLNTRDFTEALSILESLPRKSEEMATTYQKVTYARAVELQNNGKEKEALELYKKSMSSGSDHKTKALINYRLGDLAYKAKDFNQSSKYLNDFLVAAKGITDLPDDATIYMANYTLGFNALKAKNYSAALKHFEATSSQIKTNSAYISNDYIKTQIYMDALQKAGDCAFKLNNYPKALENYNAVLTNAKGEKSYALFQKGMVLGLTNRTDEKIRSMIQLIDDNPGSAYIDDAYYQLGVSYQELGKLASAKKPLELLVDEHPNSELYKAAYFVLD